MSETNKEYEMDEESIYEEADENDESIYEETEEYAEDTEYEEASDNEDEVPEGYEVEESEEYSEYSGEGTRSKDGWKQTVVLIVIVTVVVLIVGGVAVYLLKSAGLLGSDKPETTGESTTAVTDVTEVPVTPVETNFTTTGELGYLPTEEKVQYFTSNRNTWALFNGVVGEIIIPKVSIRNLVFQSLFDNEEFLYVDEYGEYSEGGCIFGDYRNNFNILDANNVIYGHNMTDGSMFAPLLKLRDTSMFDDGDVLIYFNSEGYNNIFKVYSVYEIDLTTFNYIQTGFTDEQSKQDFIMQTQAQNEVDALLFEEVPQDAKLITLSTCTNMGKNRFVVHGYLLNRDVV